MQDLRDDDQAGVSRRTMIRAGVLAAPVVLAAGGQAFSQPTTQAGGTAVRPLAHPLHDHPRPPFEKATLQEWPGLASKMDPRPDHGEQSYKGSGKLAGRRALVTGGDSGIGRAAAIAFAREGADVAINYLPAEQSDADEVVKLIRDAGRKAVAIAGDLRDEAFCKRLVDDAVRQLGGLDVLVNNAAIQRYMPDIAKVETADFDAIFKANVYAMFWLTKAAVPHLPPGSCIIQTASIQAYDPSPQLFVYAQTKACQVSFTKSMAKQLLEKGIRVNAVAPGPYWTPLQPTDGKPLEKLKEFGAESPYKRPGQPAEIAHLFVMLASAESSYVTGEVFGSTGLQMPF